MEGLYKKYRGFTFDSAKINGKWYPRIAVSSHVIDKPCDTEFEAYKEFCLHIDSILKEKQKFEYCRLETSNAAYWAYFDFGSGLLVFIFELDDSKFRVYDDSIADPRDSLICLASSRRQAIREAIKYGLKKSVLFERSINMGVWESERGFVSDDVADILGEAITKIGKCWQGEDKKRFRMIDLADAIEFCTRGILRVEINSEAEHLTKTEICQLVPRGNLQYWDDEYIKKQDEKHFKKTGVKTFANRGQIKNINKAEVL